jgi:hypothetical protein
MKLAGAKTSKLTPRTKKRERHSNGNCLIIEYKRGP